MRIKKGDNVIVVSGKDRGKTGKIVRALPRESTVLIEGVNVKKKHQRPRRANQKGQIIDRAVPIHVSNVMIADPKTGKPTRIRYEVGKDGKKVRMAKKSGTAIS